MPSAITSAKYITYATDVSPLVINSIESDEVRREIQIYEMVTGAKITCDKSSVCVQGNVILSQVPSVGQTVLA